MSNLVWINIAQKYVGTKETPGKANNQNIMNWAALSGLLKTYSADSVPWCGLFTAWIMVQTGLEPVKDPLWALNWNKYGTKLSEPAYGCIITFKRTGGGHVGFYLGENASYYYVLGGNQSDSVSVTAIAKSRAQAFRWPPGMEKFLKKGRVKTTIKGAQVSVNEA